MDDFNLVGLILDLIFWAAIGYAVFQCVQLARRFPEWRRQRSLNKVYRKEQKARARVSQQLARERLQHDQSDPPWVTPRALDSTMNKWAYDSLLERLDLVEDRSHAGELLEYLHDRETGQLWAHFDDEVGFNQFRTLAPIERVPPENGNLAKD